MGKALPILLPLLTLRVPSLATVNVVPESVGSPPYLVSSLYKSYARRSWVRTARSVVGWMSEKMRVMEKMGGAILFEARRPILSGARRGDRGTGGGRPSSLGRMELSTC